MPAGEVTLTFIFDADGENEEALLNTPQGEKVGETISRLFTLPLFSLPPDATPGDTDVGVESTASGTFHPHLVEFG
jgi:hypothetical protein